MGQRANYIIKEGDNLTIHYNHWRANLIATDLYLGESRFLDFVNDCQIHDEIMTEVWIEGCVIIDLAARELLFWQGFEFTLDSSIVAYYLSQLSKKWAGWKIAVMENRMYDVERILGIDYISNQELTKPYLFSEEAIIADFCEEWVTAVVIIRDSSGLFVTKTGNLNNEKIIGYGEDIIPLLTAKPPCELPREGEEGTDDCIIIDRIAKGIVVGRSCFGLWEQSKHLWDGYSFTMGDFGYLGALRISNIDYAGKELSFDEVLEQFNELVDRSSNFDPAKLAERIVKDHDDVQFNPDFFDKVQPKKTLGETLRQRIKKLFRSN